MEMDFRGKRISIDKELNRLDELALLFSERLSAAGMGHVFVSGYVAILFGRNRSSEDVDVICKTVQFETFARFWKGISKKMECVITKDARTAYDDYLMEKTALRFAYKGTFIPNVEMKFDKTSAHRRALASPLIVEVNGDRLPIGPLEQQVAYKLYMGSEKDIEDARFLFKLFEEHLDKGELAAELKALKVPHMEAMKNLGWSK